MASHGGKADGTSCLKMGRADLQLHSDLGDGLSSIEEILDSAERVGLDVIALTDHDDIRGAFALRELAAQRSSPVAVVPGVEVTTRSGHLLALWIEDEIPMFCTLAEALSRIHAAGGVAIVPHPLSYLTFSIGEGALRQLAAYRDETRMVDAIGVRERRNDAVLALDRVCRRQQLTRRLAPQHVRASIHHQLVGRIERQIMRKRHRYSPRSEMYRTTPGGVRPAIKSPSRTRRRISLALMSISGASTTFDFRN